MRRFWPIWVLLACGAQGGTVQAAEPAATSPVAAPLRDPTVPPPAARAPAPVAADPGVAARPQATELPRHLMVLGGRPYVIERGWPRGVGDTLGEARIERIEGGQVWLRDATGVHRHSLYPGVLIRPAAAPAVAASAAGRPTHAASARPRRPNVSAASANQEPLP